MVQFEINELHDGGNGDSLWGQFNRSKTTTNCYTHRFPLPPTWFICLVLESVKKIPALSLSRHRGLQVGWTQFLSQSSFTACVLLWKTWRLLEMLFREKIIKPWGLGIRSIWDIKLSAMNLQGWSLWKESSRWPVSIDCRAYLERWRG